MEGKYLIKVNWEDSKCKIVNMKKNEADKKQQVLKTQTLLRTLLPEAADGLPNQQKPDS